MDILISNDIEANKQLAIQYKKDFKIRKGANYSEMVLPRAKQRIISNTSDLFAKGIFLFKMVATDVDNYLEENGAVEPVEKNPVNFENDNYNAKNTVGIDLDHAYWRIAYLKGYITENTYIKGLGSKHYKAIRLASLSNLGRSKQYDVYVKGEYKYTEITKEDKVLIDLYNDIRYTTFGVMREIADMLGDDFYCWKTDCIYFKDLQKNRKAVIEIVESYDLLWKYEQL